MVEALHRASRRAGVALVLCCALASSAAGQVVLPYLLTLPSERVPVQYTPGTLDRASHVQDRFELLVTEISHRSKADIGLVVHLLSREEWESAGIEVPYGLPAALGPQQIAIAALGDPGTVALWKRLAGDGVPRLAGRPVRGTIAEAESLSALDLAAEVEVARLLLPALDANGGSEWWEPLVAQTLAWSAFLRFEPGRRHEISTFFGGLVGVRPSAEDSVGGAADRLIESAHYAAPALRIADVESRPPARPFLKWLRKKGNTHSPADREERFRMRYPSVAEWLSGAAIDRPE